MALLHLAADKSVDSDPVALPHQEGIHLLPSRRQLVQHGHLQIAVHQQRQRPGDGGGRHNQQMGVVPLGGQGRPLVHAEAVLLVGNHQPQLPEHRGLGQQGVGAHRHRRRAVGQLFPGLPLLPLGHGAGEQYRFHAQRRKQPGKGRRVLLRQNFRGSHQRRLAAVPGGQIGGGRRHHGFTAAHVALNQPVHGGAPAEIPADIRNRPPLGAGEGEGQRIQEGRQVQIGVGGGFHRLPGRPHHGKAGGEYEKFLEGHPPPGLPDLLHVPGHMDGPVGPVRREQVVALPDLRRQHLLRRVAQGHGLLHRLHHGAVGQPRRQRVQGQDPPGDRRRSLHRLEHR